MWSEIINEQANIFIDCIETNNKYLCHEICMSGKRDHSIMYLCQMTISIISVL